MTSEAQIVTSSTPTAEGAAVPYLAVPVGAGRRALEWYVRVLGAEQTGDPIVMPDGRIGHSELRLSGGRLFLSEAHPEIGVVAPEPDRTSVSLVLTVPDVAGTVAKAVDEGGRITRPLYDDYGSRNAVVVDPFGHRWFLRTPLSSLPIAYGPGDIGYVSLFVPDVERAAAFYAEVLGWTYGPGSGLQGRHVRDTLPAQGLWGGQHRSTAFCSFAVADVAEAVQRVRAAGGEASEPEDRPFGPVSDCVDDQGMRFSVYQAPGGGSRPPANGARQGDVSYLALEVVDSAKARAFYGAVLGWTFTRGQAADGWGVESVVPMTGISGGHAEATGVPMWRVDDIAAAVERVRAAGGTATEPERRPYGTAADCTDDQGTRFYLGAG